MPPAALGAAALIGSVGVSLLASRGPDVPSPTPGPDVPTRADAAGVIRESVAANARRRGRASTILGSKVGDDATVQTQTLLG